MKNGCEDILEAKVAERNEKAKKLYRYVNDVARRIDEATAACNTIADLFSKKLELQRQKLRDNCEKLFFLDPVNYAKKSLELLWRKVYYETVSSAKKFLETDSKNDNYLFTHIVCGVGNLHHVITRIQSDMKISIKKIDFITDINEDEESLEVGGETSEEEMQIGKAAIHSCLIYLGDLCRYQVETTFQSFDSSIAARYYLQAAQMDLSSGMPFNQLGNLYLDKNYNLNSVSYYIHCLNCTNPFEGSVGNLTKIFDKNNQVCDTLNDSETLTQAEHVQYTVANFLSLIEIWYMGKNDTNIPQRCSTIAQELKIAMEFNRGDLPDLNKNYNEFVQMNEEENINPSFFNNNLQHNMVKICLFTIAKLSETDEQKAFECKAFTLALMSQLLQKLLKQLQSLGFQNPARKYNPKVKSVQNPISCVTETEEVVHITLNSENKTEIKKDTVVVNGESNKLEESSNIVESDEDSIKGQNGDVKNVNKKALTKRRRRRRRSISDTSDVSNINTDSSDEDMEDSIASGGDLSDSTYESDDETKSERSCDEDSNTEVEDNINGNTETEKTEINDDNMQSADKITNGNIKDNTDQMSYSEESNKPIELNASEIKKFLLGENFLHSIKLLVDWVLSEKDLIVSCGDSGEALFQCVVDLLNIFNCYFNSKSTEDVQDCEIIKYAKTVANNLKLEYKFIPLPEDVNLRGTSICKFDKNAAEWQILEKFNMSLYEENVIRILNFIDFGQQIAKLVPKIRYNRSLKIFYLKKLPLPKVNTKIGHKRSREWHNSKKLAENASDGGSESALLRRLGRLWLASRVKELERSGRRAAPSLLALDSAALTLHLRRVKQLLRARSFVLLVPTIVLQELDDMKKERSTARDAIRWLEVQLRSGSRFLRAQRPGQSKPLPLLKYPRKAPPHVHNFVQILEFCNHFTEERTAGGDGDPDSSAHGKSAPLLVLLLGTEPGKEEEHYKDFSLVGAASSAGITLEYIGDFYSKWKQTTPKTGKKR